MFSNGVTTSQDPIQVLYNAWNLVASSVIIDIRISMVSCCCSMYVR